MRPSRSDALAGGLPLNDEPLALPPDALVVLVGPSGAGKSTWAAAHFPPDAVLSSDAYREAISGDAGDQTVTDEAFRRLHADADARLAAGLPTVIDATNIRHDARQPLLDLAARHSRPAVAVVFDRSLDQCLAWNQLRPGRRVTAQVVRRQWRLFQRALPYLADEHFAQIVRVGGE